MGDSGIFVSLKEIKPGWLYLSVLFVSLLVYTISCAPSSLWIDSGMTQYRVWHNDIEGGLGLALSHPVFYMVAIAAKCVPFGEFGWRVNMISAVAGALVVANVFLLLRLWLGRNFPGIVAAVSLMLSHTFWSHSSIAEVYTLYVALFSIELIMLLLYVQTKRTSYLYWLGFFNGLAIAEHMFGSIPLLCYAVFFIILLVKKKIGFGHLAIIILFWILGALPYEYLIIKNIIQGGDFVGVLSSAVFGNRWQGDVLNISLSMRIVKENIMWILLNFPTPNILFLFFGVGILYKASSSKAFVNIILALLILFFGFAFRYTIVDRYVFFMPFYFIASILMGVGSCLLLDMKYRKQLICLVLLFSLLPIPVYAVVPNIAKRVGMMSGRSREIPYRDDLKYFLQPWKTGYRGAQRFADEALAQVENNAIIYADGTTVYALSYAQEVEGNGVGIDVVSGHASFNNLKGYDETVIDELFSNRAIYVVSPVEGYCPEFLLDKYDFVKTGVLYRVVAKK
ncbi:MAG: DUF2723 domain-containing protein [Planctomycetes bacterium]|nr:DUF2723 domain-containing protein [Planctomycetota bacterium]